jgi:hypothetical protein
MSTTDESAPQCEGVDEYSGIRTGQSVVVRDPTGNVVGRTALTNAAFRPDGGCVFRFQVLVPDANSYRIEIGEGQAWPGGTLTVSGDFLEGGQGTVNMFIPTMERPAG